MRFWEFGQIWSVLATVIVAVSAAAAAAASSDWQLASSDENLFDLNPADGKDWALGTDPFSEGGGDIASSSGIPSYLSSSDDVTFINVDENQQLFLNNNDPQTELLFADMDDLNAKGGEQCASSNLAGKFRRRSECGTTGIVTAGPTSTVGDVTLLDRLYCPTASIFIKSLFVCSSPDPLKTIPGPLAFWTLYESTRLFNEDEARNCEDPSALFCCGDWWPTTTFAPIRTGLSVAEILNTPPTLEFVGTGIGCTPFGPFVRRPPKFGVEPDNRDGDGDGD